MQKIPMTNDPNKPQHKVGGRAAGCVQRVTVHRPSLENNTADAERLIESLKPQLSSRCVSIDFSVLRQLPELLRDSGHLVRCAMLKTDACWQVAGIKGGADPSPMAGLAVDLGTTRVVLQLIDLESGQVLSETAFDNPQLKIAPDILARIHYCEQPRGLRHLQSLIVDGLNDAVARLCAAQELNPTDIFLTAVAGNTAMAHLFMGLDPRWIIREPYIPAVNRPDPVKPAELGLSTNPAGRVIVFPNIGSYFGGDLIAGILCSGLDSRETPAILVDVGTNAEVVVGNRDWLMACAGAAGPALESGVASIGMMAGPGAIDRVTIHLPDRRFELHTIGDQPPRGICGSGVIDLAAQLFLAGMLDIRGKLIPENCGQCLYKDENGIDHLVLVPAEASANGTALTISQPDIDSLIRSKAAMYTILETITASVGMRLEELDKFYIAGTFGSFINPASAIALGMLPDLPLERYEAIGNSSLGGARQVLQSPDGLEKIERIRSRITYLELNVNQEFMNRFSAAKFLPHTDTTRFPSIRLHGDRVRL